MTKPFSADSVLRIRRHQPTRLEGFVDASFAFALTLLVISVGHIPSTVADMLQALRGLPAFALSFLLLTRLWNAHRNWSRHYDLEDGAAISLSLSLVFIVLVFVYPLRFLFSLLFAWLSDGFLVEQPIVMHTVDEYRIAMEVYGLGFAAIAVVFIRLYSHALKKARDIGLGADEILATRMHANVWWMQGGIALLSALSAAILPFSTEHGWFFGVPGSLYALIGMGAPLIRKHYARRILALAPA
jgi:Endosomal/lysosomal potassium channel TMEM175